MILLEPAKALLFNKKKEEDRVIQNIIKSQINVNKDIIQVEKGYNCFIM